MYIRPYLFVEKLREFLKINYFLMFDNIVKNKLEKVSNV